MPRVGLFDLTGHVAHVPGGHGMRYDPRRRRLRVNLLAPLRLYCILFLGILDIPQWIGTDQMARRKYPEE